MLSEIEQFVNWVRRRSSTARTWKDYGYDLRFFMQVVSDVPLKEITFREVDKFVAMQSEKGFKPSTINRRLASIASLYNFFAPEDDDLICPVHFHRHHIRQGQRLPKPMDEKSLKQFFAVIHDKRDLAMFTLMLRRGLRIGEVANLSLADLFISEEYPRLVARGKVPKERSVYLSNQVQKSLRDYLSVREKTSNEFVFLSYLQNGLSTTANT